MIGTDNASRYAGPGFAEPAPQPLFTRVDGVLVRRLFAYLIDLVFIAVLTTILAVLIGIAGLVTFGLGWTLYAILVPGALLLYSAATVGGAAQATIGMRVFGLRALDATTGGPVGGMLAAMHALLFYVAAGTLILLVADVAVALARGDRRMGHDLVAGLVLVRRA